MGRPARAIDTMPRLVCEGGVRGSRGGCPLGARNVRGAVAAGAARGPRVGRLPRRQTALHMGLAGGSAGGVGAVRRTRLGARGRGTSTARCWSLCADRERCGGPRSGPKKKISPSLVPGALRGQLGGGRACARCGGTRSGRSAGNADVSKCGRSPRRATPTASARRRLCRKGRDCAHSVGGGHTCTTN